MQDALRRAVLKTGLDIQIAARAAATTPARVLGIGNRTGSIRVGRSANLVALDDHLQVLRVIVFRSGGRHRASW